MQPAARRQHTRRRRPFSSCWFARLARRLQAGNRRSGRGLRFDARPTAATSGTTSGTTRTAAAARRAPARDGLEAPQQGRRRLRAQVRGRLRGNAVEAQRLRVHHPGQEDVIARVRRREPPAVLLLQPARLVVGDLHQGLDARLLEPRLERPLLAPRGVLLHLMRDWKPDERRGGALTRSSTRCTSGTTRKSSERTDPPAFVSRFKEAAGGA